jgi:hypothetical protein
MRQPEPMNTVQGLKIMASVIAPVNVNRFVANLMETYTLSKSLWISE